MTGSRIGSILSRHPLVLTLVAVIAVKLVWFVVDRVPLFYMGDSRAYIHSAISGAVLPDRSNTYGWLIWVISVVPGTLTTLIFAQTLAGIATASLLAYFLMRFFKTHVAIAVAGAVAFAVEPLQILHERMVLTESFAVLLLVLYLLLGLSYLLRPRAILLVLIAATGVLLLSLRLVYIPVTLLGAALIPSLAWANSIDGKRFIAHLVLSLLATLCLHQAYKIVTGFRANLPPAYDYAGGSSSPPPGRH